MRQVLPDRIRQNIQIRQSIPQCPLVGVWHVRRVHYIRVRLARQFCWKRACAMPGQVGACHVENIHGCVAGFGIPPGEKLHDVLHAGVGAGDMREECMGLVQHESLRPFEDQGVEVVHDIRVCHAEGTEHAFHVFEKGIQQTITGQKTIERGGNGEDAQLSEPFGDVYLSDVVQTFPYKGFAVQVGNTQTEAFILEIPLDGLIESNSAAPVPPVAAECFRDLVDQHVVRGCDGASAVCKEDRTATEILQNPHFPVEEHGIHHEEGAQKRRQSGEGSGSSMPEDMPPAILQLDGMAGLGTAVETHDETFRMGCRKIIRHQAFSLVSIIRADHDLDSFHGIGLLPGGVPMSDTPPLMGMLLQQATVLLSNSPQNRKSPPTPDDARFSERTAFATTRAVDASQLEMTVCGFSPPRICRAERMTSPILE